MGESMALVLFGVAAGAVTALAASRLVTSLLYGLAPTDVATMVTAIAVLVIVSAVAGYMPARRAAQVDPLVALHYE
jgi:ABC-type antimicrobial peptide transport system permease subunit